MGIIDEISKYDLDKMTWHKPEYAQRGRSFALASYPKIMNANDEKIDYIILAQGSRVEDHTKDYMFIKKTEVSVNTIINYFKNSNKNIFIKTFFMDADAPIKEDAKLLAKYIDDLAVLPTTNSINVIGISKCGTMAFYIPKHFKYARTFEKTNIYTVASPFNGTKMASPKIFYPEMRKVITSKLGDNNFSNNLSDKLVKYYESISSNSHMDYDIAVPGGIPSDKLNRYDKSFISNIFSKENIEGISKVNTYNNIVTGIDNKTLREAILTVNPIGIGMCVINDLFFDKKSDGFIMIDSQRIVETKVSPKQIRNYKLVSAHHDVPGNTRAFKDLLHIVDDTIDEHIEKNNYKIKTLKNH